MKPRSQIVGGTDFFRRYFWAIVLLGYLICIILYFAGLEKNIDAIQSLGETLFGVVTLYILIDRFVLDRHLNMISDEVRRTFQYPEFLAQSLSQERHKEIIAAIAKERFSSESFSNHFSVLYNELVAEREFLRENEDWVMAVSDISERYVRWKIRVSFKQRVARSRLSITAGTSFSPKVERVSPDSDNVFNWISLIADGTAPEQRSKYFELEELAISGVEHPFDRKIEGDRVVYTARVEQTMTPVDIFYQVSLLQPRKYGSIAIPIHRATKGFQITANLSQIPFSSIVYYVPMLREENFKLLSFPETEHEVLKIGSQGWCLPGDNVVLSWMEDGMQF